LHDLIASLPGNLDYNINEKTSNLSGGEKQRLVEVRAFVKDSDVIILDEPSSALDMGSLHLLTDVLKEIKRNKIIIVVTHHHMLIDISDEIINFSQELITEDVYQLD
jgi:ATP-binding cassette subfamily C protein